MKCVVCVRDLVVRIDRLKDGMICCCYLDFRDGGWQEVYIKAQIVTGGGGAGEMHRL